MEASKKFTPAVRSVQSPSLSNEAQAPKVDFEKKNTSMIDSSSIPNHLAPEPSGIEGSRHSQSNHRSNEFAFGLLNQTRAAEPHQASKACPSSCSSGCGKLCEELNQRSVSYLGITQEAILRNKQEKRESFSVGAPLHSRLFDRSHFEAYNFSSKLLRDELSTDSSFQAPHDRKPPIKIYRQLTEDMISKCFEQPLKNPNDDSTLNQIFEK